MSSLVQQARSRLPRIAEQAIQRARLTVVPRAQTAAPRAPFVAVVVALLLAGVVGLLMFNTSMQQSSFAAADLEQKDARLRAQRQELQMDLDRLRDPQRVAEKAQSLGMVPMLTPAFLELSDGSVVGKPAPASPLDRIRLRPQPARVPADQRLAPRVVEVPVEHGQEQVGIEGGAPALVSGRQGRSSEEEADSSPRRGPGDRARSADDE